MLHLDTNISKIGCPKWKPKQNSSIPIQLKTCPFKYNIFIKDFFSSLLIFLPTVLQYNYRSIEICDYYNYFIYLIIIVFIKLIYQV